MNERVVKNPNFKNNGEFHRSLRDRGAGTKDWPNTHTEVEYLGNGKFGASIGVGHRVFFDKSDGNKPKKHKLTDDRPGKDYILIQGAKCCVEVYPYYAKYFDVQHEEVRLHEERWVVQRWREPPGDWFDVGAWNPVITIEEYPEPAGDVVKVTITYDTDYGVLTVEYFQRDGNALKHNVTFKNTSGSTETFRVVQAWAGIVGAKCNGKDFPVDIDEPFFAFRKADEKLTIAENLYSMIFNEDGSEKTEECLQRPIIIESHAQGMKADFIYGNWVLAQNESLEIDPDTATLDDPTEDRWLRQFSNTQAGCPTATGSLHRFADNYILFGGNGEATSSQAHRGYVEWDISAIPDAATITNTMFRYHGITTVGDEEINPITEEAPSGATDANLWGYIASGTAYVDPFNLVVGTGQEVDLGSSADSDLQNQLPSDWFAIGLQSPDNECPVLDAGELFSNIYSERYATADPKPTLYVEYTPAAGLENKSANMAAKMIAGKLI